MTRYTVVWVKSADDELAELWLSSSDRTAVTTAAFEAHQQLSFDAFAKGEPLREGLRVLIKPPLRLVFSVNEDDRLVEVALVRRT
jgi:hypothetical protein